MLATNKSFSNWLFYASTSILFVVIISKLRLMSYADDVTFSHALDNISLLNYLQHRYQTWSGRIVIEAIMVSTIGLHGFWKILIPLCFISSAYLMWSITLKNKIDYKIGTPLVMSAALIINSPVAGDSEWWVTGFYNYLLPMTCALFLANVLLSPSAGMRKLFSSLLLSFIATSSEQIAVFLVVVIPFIFFVGSDKRKGNRALAVAYVTVLIGAAITLLSPGSASRFSVEAARYMPQIAEMNILQKAIIGVDRLVENVSFGRNIIFLASSFIFIAYLCRKSKGDALSKICLIFSVTSTIICLTSLSFYMKDIDYLTYYGKFYNIDFGSLKVYGCYLFYLISLICMAVGSIESSDGTKDYRAFLTLMIGMLVTVAIGLSPTAYASGERVLYVFNISLILYSLFNIKRVID
ncbi:MULTISPECIES: DUF6056 family protein [unclassified Pantoea]|uniref:DUF6056 family protein n=1 Tax=unclassified Pantoea TaxID=2630326 RepID=UPI0012329A47|nr:MULTISPECIES: DUF6056 family protein [unclassified Pantoea]KAA5974842.1 hypothetical protein F3I51_02830 [Pantoea sp. M_6]KAA5979197.1 hypothetical protein F3I52_04395 [Pantoea sp. M_8]KAA5992029.1 hypothetical protein F3I47_09220 [Pantoea sp. M_10]